MRIVIATPFYPPQPGVLAKYAIGLEQAFQRMGHEAVVVVFPNALPAGLRHVVYLVRILFALRGASLVLSLDTWSVGVPAFFAARITGTPFRVRIGGDFLYESYLDRVQRPVRLSEFYEHPRQLAWKERVISRWLAYMVQHADAVFFNTRFQRKIWQKPYNLPNDRTHIVENHFPHVAGTYRPTAGRVLVNAQRASAFKNQAVLERIVARLANKYPGLELDTRILPPEENARRLAQAYAVIIPSISEVSSNTAIESVVSGKPFICPQDTGTSERLAACGLFIDTSSEPILMEAIESILDPIVYQRLSSAAQAVTFTHSWDEIAHELLVV